LSTGLFTTGTPLMVTGKDPGAAYYPFRPL